MSQRTLPNSHRFPLHPCGSIFRRHLLTKVYISRFYTSDTTPIPPIFHDLFYIFANQPMFFCTCCFFHFTSSTPPFGARDVREANQTVAGAGSPNKGSPNKGSPNKLIPQPKTSEVRTSEALFAPRSDRFCQGKFSILRGSGYLGYVDSNQGFFNLYKWLICPQILGL